MNRVKKRRTMKGNRLSSMQFDEISVVTSPANQHARIVFSKGLDDVARLDDGRIDYGAEFLKHGPGRMTQVEELVQKAERQLLSDDDEPVNETLVAKAERFGEAALFLEADLLDGIERRAALLVAKADAPTRDQAVAKVFQSNPDLRRAHRIVQLMKAKGGALPRGKTPQWNEVARNDRLLDVEDKMIDQESAMSVLRAEAQQMVRDGLAPTVEQALVLLLKENPELHTAWRNEFREM